MSDDYSWRTPVHRDPGSDGGAGEAPGRSAFQFDLGGALARLDDGGAPTPPAAVVPAAPIEPPRQPVAEPTPADGLLRPYTTPRSSVFDDATSSGTQPVVPDSFPRTSIVESATAPPAQPSSPYTVPGSSVFADTPPSAPNTMFAPQAPAPMLAPAAPPAASPPIAHAAPPAVSPPIAHAAPPAVSPTIARAAPPAASPPIFPSPVIGEPILSSQGSATAVLLAEPPATAAPTETMPFLPAATPMASAMPTTATVPDSAGASVADVKAFKAAQMRASRQQRRGKMFGRTVLAFAVIGGLVGAALYFGRSYLFPAEWDPELVSAVDEIQAARGAELDRTVPLVVQPAGEYAATVAGVVGGDWQDRLPEWRALGLAGAGASSDSVGAALAARLPAVYDEATDTIYRSADADPAALGPDLRLALETAFAEDDEADGVVVETPAVGFAGLSSPQRLAERAVDAHLAGRSGVAVAGTELPVPIAYEVAALDGLGESILRSIGADPEAVRFGDYPVAIYGALSDEPALAPAGQVQPGETGLADAVALGVDDWSLVWGVRLRAPTVEQLAGLVTADSYRPIERNGVVCAVGTFQTASEGGADTLLGALQNWVVLGPAEAQAAVTRVSPNQVQLVSCDPNAAAVQPDLAAVDAQIARQAARLAG